MLLLGIVSGASVAAALGFAWRRAAARVRELERRLEARPAGEEREAVARQLEAPTAQVEQLTEGQDFLARVLAEGRGGLPRPGDPERFPTTH